MCADGEQAYGSKIISPKPQRKLGICPGLEQSLEQILGPASVNLAGSEQLLIHLFPPRLKIPRRVKTDCLKQIFPHKSEKQPTTKTPRKC